MNLDTRAQRATDEVLALPRDLGAGLTGVYRARRRRAAGKAAAASLAVVLAVVAAVLGHGPQPRPEPVKPVPHVHNGALVGDQGGTLVHAAGPRVDHLPGMIGDAFLGPLQFTPDGRRFVYSRAGQILVRDLSTGHDTRLTACDQLCQVAVSPDLTRSATWHGGRIVVRLLGSGTVTRFHVPFRPTTLLSWSPDSSRIAVLGVHRAALSVYVVDASSGATTRLAGLHHYLGARPAWSPDGQTIAFLDSRWPPRQAPRISLHTVSVTGSPERALHVIGRCYCITYVPAVTWSPDGARIAVSLAGYPEVKGVGGPVYSVRPDGTAWHRISRLSYEDVLLWQPLVSRSR